jgi:hypothetical protein
MKKSIGSVFLVFVLLAVLLNGCAPASTPVSPTLTSTPSTDIPASTATPTKLPTVTPTPTIEPPSLTTEFLTDVKVLSFDPFDNMNNWDIWDVNTGSITNGTFELKGKTFWAGGLVFKSQLKEGDGVMLKFKLLKANAKSAFVFITGDWQTDSYREFGIKNGKGPKADLWQGKNLLGGNNLNGNLTLQPDTWYDIIIAIGKNGKFLAVMWDSINEGHRAVYNEKIGEKWVGKSWNFIVKANEGETVYVNNFNKFSFGEIK